MRAPSAIEGLRQKGIAESQRDWAKDARHALLWGGAQRALHRHDIALWLVRESALENDTDLFYDFGIYGSRAAGVQTADPAGRTIRFMLDFNLDKVQEAEVKWTRLGVYASSYRNLLNQNQNH